jgi:hypothetical protein
VAAQRLDARRLRRRRAGTTAVAAVLATLVVALVLALPAGAPSVADAADLALAAPTAPAPAPVPGERYLDAQIGGIAFPDWSASGWRSVGERREELDGRATRTVFYDERRGRRVGYTIVDGAPLPTPQGAVRDRDGHVYTVVRGGGATIVSWRQGDHTCVLASRDVPEHRLLALASGHAY